MPLTLPRDLDALSGLATWPRASQVLEHALDLLATPDAWCKGAIEKQAGLYFTGTVQVLHDGLVGAVDAAALGAGGVLQPVTQRCLVGAVRRALLDTRHLRTADGEPGGQVEGASGVARQAVRHVGDAVVARHPWAAVAPAGVPQYPGWEPCGCPTCTSEDLPGEAAAVRFNDAPPTTHDQVLEVLKDARGLALDAELAGVR